MTESRKCPQCGGGERIEESENERIVVKCGHCGSRLDELSEVVEQVEEPSDWLEEQTEEYGDEGCLGLLLLIGVILFLAVVGISLILG